MKGKFKLKINNLNPVLDSESFELKTPIFRFFFNIELNTSIDSGLTLGYESKELSSRIQIMQGKRF